MDEQHVTELLRRRFSYSDFDDPLDFVHRFGSAVDAVMYGELYRPRFRLIDDMVICPMLFNNDELAATVARTLAANHGDRAKTEMAMNYVEVPYLFGNPDQTGELDDDEYEDLCRALAVSWRCQLHELFPDRRFVVRVVEGQQLGIEFFQERDTTDGLTN